MASIQIENEEDILDRMTMHVVARTDFSDLVETSEFREILAAVAREIGNVHLQLALIRLMFSLLRATGDNLDLRAKDIAPFSGELDRQGSRRAVASRAIVLSRATALAQRVVYPAGVVGQTEDGVAFRTTEQAVIEANETDSNAVSAVAVLGGVSGNVDTATITRFQQRPTGLSAITNVKRFTRGRDRETDDEYRARIFSYMARLVRATPRAILGATLGLEDEVTGKRIEFQRLLEPIHVPGTGVLYIDDGAGTAKETTDHEDQIIIAEALGGEQYTRLPHRPVDRTQTFTMVRTRSATPETLTEGVDFYLDGGSGLVWFVEPLETADEIKTTWSSFGGLVELAQRTIDGDETDENNYPGYRAAGVSVSALPASVISIQFSYAITYEESVDDTSRVAEEIRTAIMDYVNNIGLDGGFRGAQNRMLIVERADAAVMGVAGVFDLRRLAPLENYVLADDEVVRITSANIDLL